MSSSTSVENPVANGKRIYLLLAAVLASAMGFINASLVNIALPGIQLDFSVDLASVQWVVNAYGITLGSLILIGGAVGDIFGRRRLFLWGLALLLAASLVCAHADHFSILVAARAVQGIGTALMVPQGLALISDAYGPKNRGRAIGWWASGTASSTALGPFIGGFLIERFDWGAAFYVNVPLGLLVVVFAWLGFGRRSKRSTRRGPAGWRDLDLIGIALLLASLFSLSIGLAILARAAGEQGDISLGPSMTAAGLAGLLLFAAWEQRSPNPIVPLRLFASRDFLLINLMTLLLYAALGLVQFLLPFKLMFGFGLSETQVGLVLLSMSASIAIGSRITSGWAARRGIRAFLVVGSSLAALSCFGLALDLDALGLGIYLPFSLLCVGMATLVAPLSSGVMEAAPSEQAGLASGVSNAAARLAAPLGIACGVALISVFASTQSGFEGQTGTSHTLAAQAIGLGYRQVMQFAGALAILAALLATGLRTNTAQPPRTKHHDRRPG